LISPGLPHAELLQLAGDGHGKLIDEPDILWDLKMGDVVLAEVPDLVLSCKLFGMKLKRQRGQALTKDKLVGKYYSSAL
jgi:hypothetical protein